MIFPHNFYVSRSTYKTKKKNKKYLYVVFKNSRLKRVRRSNKSTLNKRNLQYDHTAVYRNNCRYRSIKIQNILPQKIPKVDHPRGHFDHILRVGKTYFEKGL